MEKYDIKLLIEQRKRIEQLMNGHSERLNELPSLPNGLAPDEVKNSDFYRFHKNEYDKNFKALREFNSNLTNSQKKEISNYRKNKK